MGDPIKELHNNMVNSDLLEGPNMDYNTFLSNLAAEEGRQKLYQVLKDNGKVSADYNAFSQGYFQNFDQILAAAQAEKKKMVDSGEGSSAGLLDQTAAPTVDATSEINPLTYPAGSDPFAQVPEQSPVDLSLSNAELARKIQDQSIERKKELAYQQQASPTDLQARGESTSVVTPMKSLPDLNITGEENPLQAGTEMYSKLDEGFEFKERRAAKSPWRQGVRDMEKVQFFADKAAKQTQFAAFHLTEKFGPTWMEDVTTLTAELQNPAASLRPDEIIEKQARLNQIKSDPIYDKWLGGITAQQKSFEQYKAIGKKNPEFLREQANQELARQMADESSVFKAASFGAQVTLPVVAGIATLPRTLLGAVGLQEVPIIDQIADWGDKQTEFIETKTSLGSKADRSLWQDMTSFEGMRVQVDVNKRPVAAYKNGLKVDMTPEQVKKFTETGAGANAKLSYTGWENAGWTTAKQLANLYLMRSLGGGTEIGTGATAFITTYNDLYNEALNNFGYGPADAAQYAIANAGVQAAAEAYLGKIDVAPMKLQFARTVGLSEAKALAGKMTAKEVGKAAGKAMMKEVMGENAEELVQTATDHLATTMFNAKTGGDIKRDFDLQQMAETILITTATTILAGGADVPRAVKGQMQMDALLAAAANPTSVAPAVDQLVAAGQLTEEEGKKTMARAQALGQINAVLPEDMEDADRAQVLALELDKIQKSEGVKPDSPQVVKDEVKDELKQIDEQIEAIKHPEPPKEGEAPIETPTVQAEPTTETPAVTEVADIPKAVVAPPMQNFTESSKVNEMWQGLKGKYGEKTAKKIYDQATRLFNPNQNDIVEIRANGVVLNRDGKKIFKAFTDTDMKQWRVASWEQDVSDQFENVAPAQPEQTVDPISLISEDIAPFLDASDKENIQNWVDDNINDPEVLAQYPNKTEAVKDLVKEYEDNVLQNKYAGRTNLIAEPTAKEDVAKAGEVVANLDDAKVAATQAFVKQYETSGGFDIDKLEKDIADGVEIPEAVKQILDEQELAGGVESDQRNEIPDGAVEGPQSQEQNSGIDTTEAGGIDVPKGGKKETTEQKTKKVDAGLKKAKLPPLDDDVLQELANDGLIDSDTFFDAHNYLKGDINEKTARAFNQALDAREGLRNVPPRTPLIVNDDIQVYRRESDGVLEVSGDAASSYGLKFFGGKYNPATRKWEMKGEGAVNALEHIVESNAPVVEQSDGGAMGNQLVEALKAPGAVINAKRRRNRYKAASSFGERVQIASVEHGTRPEVADPKKVQKVLAQLQKSMPGVEVVTDQAEVTAKINEVAAAKGLTVEVRDGIPGFLMEDGRWEAPVAFESDGVVYVNPRIAHVDALIHEFGHIWNSWLRKNNPTEHAKGIALAKESDYMDAVKDHPLYSDLPEEQQAEEALAYAIGDAGRRITEMGPFMRFRVWLADMWREVQRMTGVGRPAEMTLLQWANYHAETLLSGNEATKKTGQQIVSEEQQIVQQQRAQAMERAGYFPEDIYAATGWKRADGGDWYFDALDVKPKFDTTTEFQFGETMPITDVLTVPALAGRADVMVRIESGVKAPRMDGNTIVMSPVMDQAYLQKAVALAQGTLVTEKLDEQPAEPNQPARFSLGTPQGNATQGSTPQAARIQSAKQIIRIEMQNEGMKDYEAKTRQLAKALGLRYEDVLKVWQDEASHAQFGRITVALGDAKAMGAGKWGQIVEAASVKKEIVAESLSTWFRRYFTVKGLFPAEIKHLADQAGDRIAGRLRGARFLMADLNAAMKAEYGKGLTEAHWRLVDNVMRGEGQWDVLPDRIVGPAKAMRDFTDALSQELITSGATNSKMIITILNNSGVAATEENMKDWQGANLFEALDKLPYERTAHEEAAIKDFLRANNKMLGSYFYRSYRKHKDKSWAKRVPPAVLQDAREFLHQQISSRIALLERARDAKVEDIEMQIEDVYDAINAVTDGIAIDLANSKDPADIQTWMDETKDAKAVTQADIEIIMALTEVDKGAYSDRVWAIIEARKMLSDLQDLQDAAVNFNEAEIDNLSRILSIPFGAKQGGIDGIIYNEILAVEETEAGMVSNANLGSKDLAFLKRRKNIPEPIRELMGEYHDARLNFASSVMRMISVVENQQLLISMRKEFEGKYFWPPEMKDMGVELAAVGTASMDPLNGWHTTKEIAMAFKDFHGKASQMPFPVRALRGFADMVKYGKTIVSPVTHFRNFFSNMYFAAQNGYSPKAMKNAWVGFHNAWSKNSDPERRAYIEKLVSLGIMGEGAWSGDLRSLMERINGDAVDQLMVSGNLWTTANRFLQQTYQAEDDFWRVLGFETEKARYAKNIYGRPFEQLDQEQQADVERNAADIVSETLPTYSKVPKFAQALREIPIFGTFIAFPAEMFRITANQVKRVNKEMRDPRTRGTAMVRLLGMGLAQGLPAGAVALFRHLVGVSPEEEDAARYFVPEWQKNSPWVWDTFTPGKEFSFRNLGYSDPYSFYKKPIITMLANNGKDMPARLAEAAYGLLQPFIDVELTTGTILALAYNKDPRTNEDIYVPGKGLSSDWRSTAEFTTRQLQPGVVKFGYDVAEAATGVGKYGRPPKEWDDIALNMVGYQTEKTNVEKAVRQKVFAAKKELDYSREYFLKYRYKFANDPEGLDEHYERAAAMYRESLKTLSLCVRNAEIIGMPPQAVNEIVTGSSRSFSNSELEAARSGALLMPTFKGYNK